MIQGLLSMAGGAARGRIAAEDRGWNRFVRRSEIEDRRERRRATQQRNQMDLLRLAKEAAEEGGAVVDVSDPAAHDLDEGMEELGQFGLGEHTYSYRYRPSETKRGRAEAAYNREKGRHGDMAPFDATRGDEYTKHEDADLEEDRKIAGLVAGGMDRKRAEAVVRTGFDPEKERDREEDQEDRHAGRLLARAQAAAVNEDRADRRRSRALRETTDDATGVARKMVAEGGNLPGVQSALERLYKGRLTPGLIAGIAADAVRWKEGPPSRSKPGGFLDMPGSPDEEEGEFPDVDDTTVTEVAEAVAKEHPTWPPARQEAEVARRLRRQ